MILSIVVPVYNEEHLVTQMLDNLLEVRFPDFLKSFEIIVVDDCSSDNTYFKVSEYLKSKNISSKVVRHVQNMGKGAACKTGFSYASGNVYLVQDADLELSPKDIPTMLEAMHNLGVQFVNGSRYLSGVLRPLSSYKRYKANKFLTLLTSILIDVKITDMACGYKLVHKDLYEKIDLKENRFGFEAEFIIKALRIKRNNITEVPVGYSPRNNGEGKKIRNLDAFNIFWTIMKYGLFKFN